MKYGYLRSAVVEAVNENMLLTYVFKVDECVANAAKVSKRIREAVVAGKKSLLAIVCEI